MGLAERRAIAKIQADTLPKVQSELDAIAGTHIELAINWDSYSEQPISVIESHLPNYGLAEIVKAFGTICRDDMGKDAVRSGVTKVEFRCPAKGEDNVLKFEDKVVTILVGEESYGYWRADNIASLLESKL